ncbi:MAG: hypothetical protein M3040_07195, partial [Bacteroidota bacterium]|nr:hypothetical protein [Bacteroidota bacterium]
ADPCIKTDAGKWFVLYSPTINLSSNSTWRLMADQHGEGRQFIPVPANYETGDKKADIAILDVKTGIYHIDFSSNQFGSWDFVTEQGKAGDDFKTDNLYLEDINNLTKLQKANFNLILGDTYYKGNRQKDYYLALMHHTNLKVMLAEQGISNHIFNGVNGRKFLTHINSLKPMYREHIYAIDLGDEPTGCKAAHIKDWVRFFDTTRLNTYRIPVFYNLLPTYASTALLSPDCSSNGTYADYLNALISSDAHDSSPFISFDHYPFTEAKGFRSDYFENLRLIKNRSKASGNKPFWATVGTNYLVLKRKLTYEELKFSAFIPIAYGAKGIMYWSYDKFIDNDEVVYNSIQKINRYIKDVIAPVVMKFENVATLHKDNTRLNGTYLFSNEEKVSTSFKKDKSLILNFSSDDIVVGIFSNRANGSKTKYLWIVNKETSPSKLLNNVTLMLNGDYSHQVKIATSFDNYSKTSNLSYTAITTVFDRLLNVTSVTLPTLQAGDGVMLSIKK